MPSEALEGPDARLTFVNVATGVTHEAQYNPSSWDIAGGADYTSVGVLGAGYEELQFKRSKSDVFSGQLFYNVVTPQDGEKRQEAEKFFGSLTRPRRGAGAIIQHPPPRVILIWPRGPSMVCVLLTYRFRASRFNRAGEAVEETVDLQFKEARDGQLFSQDVAQRGFRRSSARPAGGGLRTWTD